MKQWLKNHTEIIQAIIALFIAIIAGIDMIGKPTRLVNVIILIAGSFGAGVGLGVFTEKIRTKRRAK